VESNAEKHLQSVESNQADVIHSVLVLMKQFPCSVAGIEQIGLSARMAATQT